jgi:hypothetical protein
MQQYDRRGGGGEWDDRAENGRAGVQHVRNGLAYVRTRIEND